MSFESQTILNAIKLLDTGLAAGFRKTDAFPGKEGEIAVVFYRGESRYEFTVDQQGALSYLHENGTDELACDEKLSLDEAVNKIETLLGLWNLYFYCTSPNTMKTVVVSAVRHSKDPAGSMEEESQLLSVHVPWMRVIPYAPISENSIRALPRSHQSSGSLTPLSCRELR
jgi:hypothetical protein